MTASELRTALHRQTRAVADGFGQLVGLADEYRRAAWGPSGEPNNRANEALLALEHAREELEKAAACYGSESPPPLLTWKKQMRQLTAPQMSRLWVLSGKVEKEIPLTPAEWTEYQQLSSLAGEECRLHHEQGELTK